MTQTLRTADIAELQNYLFTIYDHVKQKHGPLQVFEHLVDSFRFMIRCSDSEKSILLADPADFSFCLFGAFEKGSDDEVGFTFHPAITSYGYSPFSLNHTAHDRLSLEDSFFTFIEESL